MSALRRRNTWREKLFLRVPAPVPSPQAPRTAAGMRGTEPPGAPARIGGPPPGSGAECVQFRPAVVSGQSSVRKGEAGRPSELPRLQSGLSAQA